MHGTKTGLFTIGATALESFFATLSNEQKKLYMWAIDS